MKKSKPRARARFFTVQLKIRSINVLRKDTKESIINDIKDWTTNDFWNIVDTK